MRRFVVRLMAGALAATSLGGCFLVPASDRKWVSNAKERMFVRIPKSWKTYTIDPYKVLTERPAPIKRNTSRWSMVIDSRPINSITSAKTQLAALLPTNLVAEMSVQPLAGDWGVQDSRTLREDISIGLLRRFAFRESTIPTNDSGIGTSDPVKAFLDGEPSVEVVAYKESATKDGLQGLHVRLNVEASPGKWLTVDQQILVDRRTAKLYRLVLKCESACFKRQYREAKRISSSWTVRK